MNATRGRLTLALVALGIAGCASSVPAKSPEASPAPVAVPPTRAPAWTQKERVYAHPPSSTAPGGSEGLPKVASGPGLRAEPTLQDAESTFSRAELELSSAGQSCVIACKALTSMQRAQKQICQLNGPNDPGSRCQQARRRLASAEERVRRSCGSCPPEQ